MNAVLDKKSRLVFDLYRYLKKIGNEITVQPTSSTDIKSGISDTIGFQETVLNI